MVRSFYFFFALILLFPIGQTFGENLRFAAAVTVEPYIFPNDNSGFELDIIREIFSAEGYDVEFIYQPLQRTKRSFQAGTVDGVLTIKSHYPEIQDAFISQEYITYYNLAVTLQSNNISIQSIDDLYNHSVTAFQQARIAFNDEFYTMAETNPLYNEIANQRSQIARLFDNRTDVIILDRRIFQHHRQQLLESPDPMMERVDFSAAVSLHYIFSPSSFRMAFTREDIRDIFDVGLQRIQESGRYDKIIAEYVEE